MAGPPACPLRQFDGQFNALALGQTTDDDDDGGGASSAR
jgi:hypothetical protein